ncbi:MAG: ribosome small subunit-dependent GTPase A [Leptospiraceae bacterium]|nr:ribosome small subunit-dependent GTPase A [Leptospiraceae bacterium]MCP5502988.1 ribosome small subunit-dependent GTPase A [Leptospiraceae bacterium]
MEGKEGDKLKKLGFQDSYLEDLDSGYSHEFTIGRISKVLKNKYFLHEGKTEFPAELTGSLLFSSVTESDLPLVGDFVLFKKVDESLCIIERVLKRKNFLQRKSSGREISYQPIAANIDYAFIMQSLDNNFNPNRIERYLSIINDSNITPIILLSKEDLISQDQSKEILSELKSLYPDYSILSLSRAYPESIETLKEILVATKTYIILGSSGVGKTSLLNSLDERHQFKTKELSDSSQKGKHTTTNRYFTILDNGAIFIDTPGMREISNFAYREGIGKTFQNIVSFEKECKFNNCTHTTEPGCAVLKALSSGLIDSRQYDNFQKMLKEDEYLSSSYVDKRKKDKERGKLYRSILKNKPNKRS